MQVWIPRRRCVPCTHVSLSRVLLGCGGAWRVSEVVRLWCLQRERRGASHVGVVRGSLIVSLDSWGQKNLFVVQWKAKSGMASDTLHTTDKTFKSRCYQRVSAPHPDFLWSLKAAIVWPRSLEPPSFLLLINRSSVGPPTTALYRFQCSDQDNVLWPFSTALRPNAAGNVVMTRLRVTTELRLFRHSDHATFYTLNDNLKCREKIKPKDFRDFTVAPDCGPNHEDQGDVCGPAQCLSRAMGTVVEEV